MMPASCAKSVMAVWGFVMKKWLWVCRQVDHLLTLLYKLTWQGVKNTYHSAVSESGLAMVHQKQLYLPRKSVFSMRHSIVLMKHWEPLTKQHVTSRPRSSESSLTLPGITQKNLCSICCLFALTIIFCVGSWKIVSNNKWTNSIAF
jgi:hypothetical protein